MIVIPAIDLSEGLAGADRTTGKSRSYYSYLLHPKGHYRCGILSFTRTG